MSFARRIAPLTTSRIPHALTNMSTSTASYHTHFPQIHDAIRPLFPPHATPDRAKGAAQYFAPFPHLKHHGITTPDIDKHIVPKMLKVVDEWKWDKNAANKAHASNAKWPSVRNDVRNIDFYMFLMRSPWAEEKRAAIGAIKHILEKRGKTKGAWVHRLAEEAAEDDAAISDSVLQWIRNAERDVLEEMSIADWGSCDTFCSLIGTVLVKEWDKRDEAMEIVKSWRFGGVSQDEDSEETPTERNLWLQRMSCVSLLKAAKSKSNHDDILLIVEEVIKNSERFAQLGAGWVVREVSAVDKPRAIKFLKTTYPHWIREGWRYAIEKLDKDTRQQMLKYKPQEKAESDVQEPPRKRRRVQNGDEDEV